MIFEAQQNFYIETEMVLLKNQSEKIALTTETEALLLFSLLSEQFWD